MYYMFEDLGRHDLEILSFLTMFGKHKKYIFSRFPERSFGTQARLDLLLEKKLIKETPDEKVGTPFIEITSLGFKAVQDHNEKFKIERSLWWQKLFIEIVLTSIISSISSIVVAYITLKLFNKWAV